MDEKILVVIYKDHKGYHGEIPNTNYVVNGTLNEVIAELKNIIQTQKINISRMKMIQVFEEVKQLKESFIMFI